MEAELLNKIADLELQNQQLKEVMPQAFAALEMLSNCIKNQYDKETETGDEQPIPEEVVKMARRTLEWLKQFRQKEEGK